MPSAWVRASALILVLICPSFLRADARPASALPPEIEALRELEPPPGDVRGMLPLPAKMRHPNPQPMSTPSEPAPPPREGATAREKRVLTLDRRTGEVTEESFESMEKLLGSRYTDAGIGIQELLEDPESVAKNFSG